MIEAVVDRRFAAGRPLGRAGALYERYRVNLLAVSRSGERITAAAALGRAPRRRRDRAAGRLSLPAGDAGRAGLPAARRAARVARQRPRAADRSRSSPRDGVLVALDVVPVAIAFFGAAVLLRAVRRAPLREAYESIEWPILDPARRADPGQRGDPHHRRHRPDRRLALRRGRDLPPGRAGADHGRRHGGDAVPQQRRDRAGDGADRGELRPSSATAPTRS